MKIQFKAFITSKSEVRISDCQDSFAYDLSKGLFAIADGVSMSLLPSIWAKALTQTFIRNNGDICTDDSSELEPVYYDSYNNLYDETLNKFSDSQREMIGYKREKIDYGASTFSGIKIKDTEISIQCIGDSVIFVYDKEQKEIEYYCSMSKDGIIPFDNSPQYFASNGMHNGNLMKRVAKLKPSIILMMTDALADWFMKNYKFIKKVKGINNHDDFYSFVNKARELNEIKDDDTTLLILDIEDDGTPILDFEVEHVDTIDELIVVDLKEEIRTIKQELSETIAQLDSKENENNILTSTITNLQNVIKEKDSHIDKLRNKVSNYESLISQIHKLSNI